MSSLVRICKNVTRVPDVVSYAFYEWCISFLLVQSLNSPFFPPHKGAEPGRAKESPGLLACACSERINQKLLVPTTLLASMCHAMPFSARALKENIFFDVDIVIKT